MQTYYKAINWNAIEDVIDKSTWEKTDRAILAGYANSPIQ